MHWDHFDENQGSKKQTTKSQGGQNRKTKQPETWHVEVTGANSDWTEEKTENKYMDGWGGQKNCDSGETKTQIKQTQEEEAWETIWFPA